MKKKHNSARAAEYLAASCLAKAKGKERTSDTGCKDTIGDDVLRSAFGRGVVRKPCLNKCDDFFKDEELVMASLN